MMPLYQAIDVWRKVSQTRVTRCQCFQNLVGILQRSERRLLSNPFRSKTCCWSRATMRGINCWATTGWARREFRIPRSPYRS